MADRSPPDRSPDRRPLAGGLLADRTVLAGRLLADRTVLALAVAVVVLLAGNLSLLATRTGDGSGSAQRRDRLSAAPLGPDQVAVAGTVGELVASAERAGPIATPLVIELPDRGGGGASIQGAIVDGARTTIVWGGGTPLELRGGGGAVLPAPLDVLVDRDRVVWYLDGRAGAGGHRLRPGRYRVVGPVAVGQGSLGVPRDEVAFEADQETVLVTSGGAYVRRPPEPVTLAGPGLLQARGTLSVRTPGGSGTVAEIRFGPGSFRVDLHVDAGTPPPTWRVDALLEGPVELR